ncbi:MarR family transcriptional regulator [Schnuerera sp. xch1]|uniref:iron dependent repressor, metal binding and dimerization domain protein n=1 Tax=Schnuerera sp. xch1 TaxID=2874283 RepID=UPI001CC0807D|nr:iron dependent repressor, metal binding and dimerization domain protein [Schnuerera sp. xch1]MBZ2174237.1 MarR family transcriptional regulator [Schnuerera sp. xch1]
MKKQREFRTVRGYQMLNMENKSLTSSMEDYLEMIYRICVRQGYTRISQLADKLNVRPSSVTKIVQKLRKLELIDYEKYGTIRLTKEGKLIGSFLLKRHEIIDKFLKNIGVEETRLKDTEMIEHDVSINTLKNIHFFNEFISSNKDIKERYDIFRAEFDNEIDLIYPI